MDRCVLGKTLYVNTPITELNIYRRGGPIRLQIKCRIMLLVGVCGRQTIYVAVVDRHKAYNIGCIQRRTNYQKWSTENTN